MAESIRQAEAANGRSAALLSSSTREALLHLIAALLVTIASVSTFAVSTVFGVAATFAMSLAVATVLPASAPIILITSFLYQNMVVAWFTPFILDNNAFDALRGANFVVLVATYGAFFAASLQVRVRPFTQLRPWLLFSIALAGVVGFYLALGAVHGTPKDAIIYFRNTITPIACFHIAVVAASLYRVELRKTLLWLGAGAILYGYCELTFQLGFLGLFHGDQYVERAIRRQIETGEWEKTMRETGFVITGLKDVMLTNFFNLPLFNGIFPQVFRIGGPNFHPISYAYALAVLSTWLLFRGRWVLPLAALPLLLVVGSKGAMVMLLIAIAARVSLPVVGPRLTMLAVVCVSVLWVTVAIGYGSTHGDYHVLGMIAGVKGFMHNPFGQGLGIGGNLSSTTLHVNWERAQATGATAMPMESAIGVMLYQMGLGSIVFFGFLAAIATTAYKLLIRTGNTEFLFAFVAVVVITANAVLQEEAFYSPLALGFCMLIIGTSFGSRFRDMHRRDVARRHPACRAS